MTTISSTTLATLYKYNAPSGVGASTGANAVTSEPLPINVSSPQESATTSFGNNSSLPLTYNTAGLQDSFRQATANKPSGSSPAQTARDAIIAAENAITQTQGSLGASSPANTSVSDILSLGTNQTNELSGSPAATVSTSAQSAQTAYLAAENAITKALGSLV